MWNVDAQSRDCIAPWSQRMRARLHVWRLRRDRMIGQHIRETLRLLVLWSLDVEVQNDCANASHEKQQGD